MQKQNLAPKIKSLLEVSNQFYQEILGYKPEQTRLEQISNSKWDEFTQERGLNSHSLGIYLPRNKTAIISKEDKLGLFHEYFGHGLYCEQSLVGREIVNLEKKLLEEEKEFFGNRSFSFEELEKFRKQNKAFLELQEFRDKNLGWFEGFAIFSEYLLSREFNLMNLFEKKYDSLSRENKESIDNIISFNKNYGDLATFYNFGLARRTTPERVKRLLGEVCKEKVNSIKFGVLFGSKKDFSDIDIYLVSNNIEPFSSEWIDARVHTQKRFEEGLRSFDLRVTDPLFSGEFFFGDKEYFEQKKQRLREHSITEEAIRYNLKKSEDYKKLEKKDFELCDQVEDPLSYAETHLTNALALIKGLKLFTRKDLLSYSKRASAEGDKPLQFQGGTE